VISLIRIPKNELVLYMFLCGLWVFSHPYQGIWHDSLFYAAQASSRLHPEVFKHDLFFRFGSQDSFTIFSPIYATFISWFGLNLSTITLLIIAHLSWFFSACKLFRQFSKDLIGWFGIALVFTMPAMYGGHGVFSYGESFLSPRVFAEALVMIALSAVMQNRVVMSFGTLLVATLLHPLVAVAGILVVTVYLSLNDLRWLWLPFIGVGILLTLSYGEIEPFSGLGQKMDSEWFEIVREANNYVFPSSWRSSDWSRLAFDILVVSCGCIIFSGRRRTMLIAVGLSGLAGVAASLIGADLLNNVLLIQLQTWRIAWLLHVSSHFTIAFLVMRLWSSPNRQILYCLFLSAWFTIQLIPYISLIIGLLAMIVTAMELNGRLPKIFQPACYVAFLAAILSGIYGTAIPLIITIWRWQMLWQPDFLRLLVELLRIPVIMLAVAGFIFLLFKKTSRTNVALAIGFALLLLTLGTTFWDRRDELDYYIENLSGPVSPFKTTIPSGSNIYWEDDLKSAWLLLQRANYFSIGQAAGILFSQRTASAFGSRQRSMRSVLGPLDSRASATSSASLKIGSPSVTAASIVDSCYAASDLDFLILSSRINDLYVEKWRAPYSRQKIAFADGVFEKQVVQEYYLYDCRLLRHYNQKDKLNTDE
jgi:hypothetical protein